MIKRLLYFLSTALKTQLFLAVVSLPILISWGIPISSLTVIGNIIFSPFLWVVLCFSASIFFTEILGMPNMVFIYFLEKVTHLWIFLLKSLSHRWLIGIPLGAIGFILLIFIMLVLVLHSKKRNALSVIFMSFCSVILVVLLYDHYAVKNITMVKSLECNGSSVILIRHNKKTIVIDNGALGRKSSSRSWLEYSLLPLLIKNFGTTSIDIFIMLKPSIIAFQALTFLALNVDIKTIYLVVWQGSADKKFLHEYKNFLSALFDNGTSLKRVNNDKKLVALSGNSYIIIDPRDLYHSYHEIRYRIVDIVGCVDGKKLVIKTNSNQLLMMYNEE